jgi:O-acetylserine/cysteine efflux transporter
VSGAARGGRLSPTQAVWLVAVAAAWGFNFVVIKIALSHFPPFFLSALRFAMVAALAFVTPRPAVPTRLIVALGLTLGLVTFSLMFFGLKAGIGAGVASVLMQAQVFFTIAATALFYGERVAPIQRAGLALGALGVVALAAARGEGVTGLGLALVMGAAAAQAGANLLQRDARGASALGLAVWMSFAPILPLLALSAASEGVASWRAAFAGLDLEGALALAYMAFVATVFGYAVWGRALAQLPAAQVAPFGLLVPAFGVLAGHLALGERFGAGIAAGAAMMIAGLALAVAGPALGAWLARRGR